GLAPFIEAGTPMVVLEPSCASVFRDEMPAMLPERGDAKALREHTYVLSEWLRARAADLELPRLRRRALVQGHCHQKSVLGFDAERKVREEMGLDAKVLESGCCGMAGSFGFEADEAKQKVSRACGERVLLPAVREADDEALVLANGFSCRTQIAHGT